PLTRLPGVEVTAPLLDLEPEQPRHNITVNLTELLGGVAGAEVVSPTAQDWVEILDHPLDAGSCPVDTGAVPNFLPKPLHRPLRRPPVQVVADPPLLLPQPPRHARSEVTS